MVGCLFRTMAPAFRLGAAAAPRCSTPVQVKATGDSMEHERHLTCRPFHLDATHGRLWRNIPKAARCALGSWAGNLTRSRKPRRG
jgi:hypothetical protein